MWTPMPLLGQIDALRHYVRMLRADINRASSEQSKHYRKRRVSPFVENLRYRRTRNAYEMVEVAEECLNRLRHARALSIADYFPGAQVSMYVVLPGHERPMERYVVKDVEWSKPDRYHFIVWQVTKNGQLFKRGTSWLFPSNRVRITRCGLPLPEETERECRYFHENARQFIDDVRDRGNLKHVFEEIRWSESQRSNATQRKVDVLPPGIGFKGLDDVYLSDDGLRLVIWFATTDGGLASLTLPVEEVEQRVHMIQDGTHAPAGVRLQ